MSNVWKGHWAMDEDHWALQSVIVEKKIGFPIDRLDFVGHLVPDRQAVHRQVHQMLYATFGLGSGAATTYADRFFPIRTPVVLHHHGSHEHVRHFYRKLETRVAMMLCVHGDYTKLRLDVPEWATLL